MIRGSLLCLVVASSILAAPAVFAQAPTAPTAPATPAAPITAERPPADIARDAVRKPQEVMAFAGVKPGMKVAELAPGGGYYTRLLSAAVGPQGKVYVVVSPRQAARPGGLDLVNGLAAVLPNIVVVTSDYTALKLPEPVDMVWTTENYHDFHNGPTANIAAMNTSVFNALKPGGIFYVEDHSAADGAGLDATSKVHRMDEAIAKTELAAAGFTLDAESNLLRNPADNKAGSNSEAGHFVTDRFMLRMKKPN